MVSHLIMHTTVFRRRRILAPLVPVFAPVFMFVDALVRGRVIAPNDGYMQMLPLRVLAARSLRDGHLPVWNPYSFSGFPLLAEAQVAALYPPNLLFVVLPVALANNLLVVASFSLAGLGAYFLARHIVGDTLGAVVAGVAFGLCGFFFGHVGHQSMIASVAWLPWTVLAYERLRDRPSALRLGLAAMALAASLLAGHPQMFFLVGFVLGVYALALAVQERGLQRLVPLVAGVAVVVVGSGLAAVQLLPTAEMASSAAHSRLSFAEATSYSYSLSHLPLVLFPYLFGNIASSGPFTAIFAGEWSLIELAGYPGLAAAVLAVAGTPAVCRDRRAAALVVAGGVCVLVALGDSTPFGRLLYQVPIYNSFRGWDRYIVGFDLAVAVLAAYGVGFLRDPVQGLRRRAVVRTVLAFLALGAAGCLIPFIGPVRAYTAPAGTSMPAVVVPLVFAGLGTLAAVRMAGRPRWAIALVVVIMLDPILSFGAFFDWRTDSPTIAEQRRDYSGRFLFGPVPDAEGGIDRFLFAGSTFLSLTTVQRAPVEMLSPKAFPSVTDAAGLRSVNGSDPLASEEYLQAVGDMATHGELGRPLSIWQPGSDVLDVLRVSLVIGDSAEGESSQAAAFGTPGTAVDVPPLEGWEALGLSRKEPGPLMRYEHQPRLADAFLVGAVEQRDRPAVLNALEGRSPFDPAALALVERRCTACDGISQPGPAGRVSSVRWEANRVEADIAADRPAMLVVSQAWWPGWTATVDGHSAPVVRANGLVQGVPVAAGAHRVVLRYSAPGLNQGALVTLTTAAAVLFAAFLGRRRRIVRAGAEGGRV